MTIFALYSDWALLAFRLAIAATFLAHGLPKLKNWRATADWFQSVGFRPGWLWGTVAGILESLGGIALAIGFYTRFFALVFVLQFAIILIWRLARKDKFVGGYELDMLVLASMLVLLTVGGGGYRF